MESVFDGLAGIQIALVDAALGVSLIFLLLLLILFTLWVRMLRKAGVEIQLRPIKAFQRVQTVQAESGESGRPLHVSLGSGSIGDGTTAESMAGLILLDQLARKAAAYAVPPIVTVAEATTMIAAQDRLREAWQKAGRWEDYRSSQVRLIAPDPAGYAVGTMGFIASGVSGPTILLGAFREEYLLPAEAGARRNALPLAGAASPTVLPFVYATAEEPLIGEEIFASGAYLGKLPAHIGSLLVLDWARALLILVILAGALAKTFL